MENKQTQEITPEPVNSTSPKKEESRSYHPPKLTRHGGLADLVQTSPGRGSDGGATFIDCRRF